MKKGIIVTLLIALLVVAAGVYYFTTVMSSSSNKTVSTSGPAPDTAQADKSESTTTVGDACAVFTVSELMDKLSTSPLSAGQPGTSSKTSDGLALLQCDWEQGSGGPSDYAIHLDVYNYASVARAKADIDSSNVNAGTLSSEILSGVADQAMFSRHGSGTPVQALIYWRKANVVYHLSAVRLDGVDRPTMELNLKNLVMSKF